MELSVFGLLWYVVVFYWYGFACSWSVVADFVVCVQHVLRCFRGIFWFVVFFLFFESSIGGVILRYWRRIFGVLLC